MSRRFHLRSGIVTTLMLDLVHKHAPAAEIRRFAFRALSPVFANQQIHVRGEPDGASGVALWVDSPGGVAMRGEVASG